MIFELKRSEDAKGESNREIVSSSLSEMATVKVLSQEISIVCLDMDEITSKEELLATLREKLSVPHLAESAIKSMNKSKEGHQSAIISLPIEAARKALQMKKM